MKPDFMDFNRDKFLISAAISILIKSDTIRIFDYITKMLRSQTGYYLAINIFKTLSQYNYNRQVTPVAEI